MFDLEKATKEYLALEEESNRLLDLLFSKKLTPCDRGEIEIFSSSDKSKLIIKENYMDMWDREDWCYIELQPEYFSMSDEKLLEISSELWERENKRYEDWKVRTDKKREEDAALRDTFQEYMSNRAEFLNWKSTKENK